MNFPVHNQILFCTNCDKILKYALFIKDILLAYSYRNQARKMGLSMFQWNGETHTFPQVQKLKLNLR